MRILTKKFLLFLLGTILMVTTCDFSSISFAGQENNAILGEVIMEPQNLQIEPDLIEHSNFQNNAMPTPVPLFKYCDDSDIDSYKLRVDSSASVQPSFTPVSSGYTSLTFESIFPTSGDYWNHLAYWDPHAGQWFDVPGQGYYATNGNHTIGGLQEGTTYRLFMSWWDYSIGGWKDLSLDMSTDYNWSTPSITATNITSTSITINVIYPKSGQYGNGLFKSDPYDFLVPGWNVTNGNYTLSELQPNTTYFFDMVWYTDGDNSWLRRKLTITVTTLPVSYPDQNIQFSNIQGPEGALPGIKDSSSILSGKKYKWNCHGKIK